MLYALALQLVTIAGVLKNITNKLRQKKSHIFWQFTIETIVGYAICRILEHIHLNFMAQVIVKTDRYLIER